MSDSDPEAAVALDMLVRRHTFGTHPCKTGVPLRTAQHAMRHIDPSLTANVPTDSNLLGVAGAVAGLPDLKQGAVGGSAAAVKLACSPS